MTVEPSSKFAERDRTGRDEPLDTASLAPKASRPGGRRRRLLLTPTRVRQAVTGHNVRYVLGFGIAGTTIGMVIVYFVFFP